MLDFLVYFGAICLLFGVVYPVCAILAYPFYRMMGGKQKFFDYIRGL